VYVCENTIWFYGYVFSFLCAEKKTNLLVRVDCIGGHTCITLVLMLSVVTLDRRACHWRVVRIAGVGVLWVANTCGLIGMSVYGASKPNMRIIRSFANNQKHARHSFALLYIST
jgi:hypothetical protein